MLDSLRFVQGAVAKKDYVPALSHFHICNGIVLGYNGTIALCTPVDMDLACSPKAGPFVKAIQTCREDTIQLSLTPTGRLSIRSGSFSAFVDCLEDAFPSIGPEGAEIRVPGGILEALNRLSPFISEDASRPWSRGILLRGDCAYATNNIIVVEYKLGYSVPVDINLPEIAINELLRIGQEPTRIQVTSGSATFWFEGGRWLRTQLLSTEWPPLEKILNVPNAPAPLPQGIFTALTDLLPFIDNLERVFFLNDSVVTSLAEGTGASVSVPGLTGGPCFNVKHFLKLEDTVEEIDLSLYPRPCLFRGKNIRGAIVGMNNQ